MTYFMILLEDGPLSIPETDLTSVFTYVFQMIDKFFQYPINLFGVTINCWALVCFGLLVLLVRFIVKVFTLGGFGF